MSASLKTTDGLSPLDLLALARTRLADRLPFLRAPVMRLVPQALPGLGTIGVTAKLTLIYDPEKILEWRAFLPGLLLHELGHTSSAHIDRSIRWAKKRGFQIDAEGKPHDDAAKRAMRIANVGGDLTINPMVIAAGFTLPEGGVFPAKLGLPANLSMEEYADLLLKQTKEDEQSGRGKTEPGTGECCSGGCGSNGGNRNEREDEADEAKGDPRKNAGTRNEVAAQVARAVRAHKEAGKPINDFWTTAADAILPPVVVSYREVLSRVIGTAIGSRSGAQDYTYRKPSRRQSALGGRNGPRLPAMHAPLPRITVICDTSGSMGGAEQAEAISHVHKLLEASGCPVTFMAADTEIRDSGRIASISKIRAMLKGGGGTDFCAPLAAAAKTRPDVVIYLTDGWGTAPERPPPFRVVWVMIGGGSKRPASWGDLVKVGKNA
jgi:predicted metal-dependent peptidase